MRNGIIYKFTNKINGKVYIGQTVNERRRYLNHSCARKKDCPKFHNAINKYGFENFDYEVIYRGDESTLSVKEIYYINLYNSTDDKFGYNISNGGEVFMRDKCMSQETKDKISKSRKGKCVREKNPMYNKHHSVEVKAKISKSLKGKHHSLETRKKMSINRILNKNGNYHKGFLFEYNNEIYSSYELAELLKCHYSTIYLHINKGETEFSIKGHLIKLYKKRDS